jgi:hypothetical protein
MIGCIPVSAETGMRAGTPQPTNPAIVSAIVTIRACGAVGILPIVMGSRSLEAI